MIWLEIGSWWNWNPTPSGIVQTCQRLYVAGLKNKNIRFFVYDRNFDKFYEINDPDFLEQRMHRRGPVVRPPRLGAELTSLLTKRDKVFFVGGPWEYAAILDNLRAIRSTGAKVSMLAYDLIPMLFPQFFPKGFPDYFSKLYLKMFGLVHEFVAISKSTEADLKRYASKKGYRIKTRVLRLGEPLKSKGGRGSLGVRLRKEYILNVSTIEIRKNHGLLFETWKILHRKLGTRTPQLVLVGQKGWLADGIYGKLTKDRMAKRHIKVLHNISNKQISKLYRSCKFTVYPSFYEGWGLPIAESLAHGKFCICSNTSSMVEISPGLTETFNPKKPKELADLIEFYINNQEALRLREKEISKSYSPQSWTQTFEDLISGGR